ncbi:MAG: TrmO family methyltransferase [Acidimicrobiia bacterium]|nr:TrmO family methyltransferase [Acidimicrobiia bacterium]
MTPSQATPTQITLTPIGTVVGGRTEPIDDDWDAVEATIELDAERLGADSTAGLEAFSHLDVVFAFHQVPDEEVERGARHPRGRSDWPKVGILAQRGKGRPNRLGVSTCELVRADGLVLHVRGLDAIDGSPVLDVKAHFAEMGPRGIVRQPDWSREIMRGYWVDDASA